MSGGPKLTQSSPLPPGTRGRTVQTITGPRDVPVQDGEALLFSFPDSALSVRVMVEQLPAASFVQGKADLIAAFDKALADDTAAERNYKLKPRLNGFEIYGRDRKEPGADVLGTYMLIDNATHIVAGLDFMDQPSAEHPATTLEQYRGLRDSFLAAYSGCVRGSATAAPAATPASTAKPAAKSVAKAPGKSTAPVKKGK